MSHLYFIKPIGMDGPIKIGFSSSPPNRLEGLASWSPWPLEIIGTLPGTMKDEFFLHSCFVELHSHHEWFRSSQQLRDAIDRCIADQNISHARATLMPKPKLFRRRIVSEDTRRRMSYHHRIRHALNALASEGVWYTSPRDIEIIIEKWSGYHRQPRVVPSNEQFARLEEFIANPLATAVRREPARRAA